MVGRSGLRQGIQHAVGKLRRCEYLIIEEVGNAGQHIGVAAPQGKPSLASHGEFPLQKR